MIIILQTFVLLAVYQRMVESQAVCPSFQSCLSIKRANANSESGIYYLNTPVGSLEVYCEMDIEGGGWTFFPWDTLKTYPNITTDIITDKSKFLLRFIGVKDTSQQPIMKISQLDTYKDVPISVQYNQRVGYGSNPVMPYLAGYEPYLYVGLIPANKINVVGAEVGYKAFGASVRVFSCDGNANAYFAFYPKAPVNSPNYQYGATWNAIFQRKPLAPHSKCTSLPESYFYFTEIHFGGCLIYDQTNRWNDYSGIAPGFK